MLPDDIKWKSGSPPDRNKRYILMFSGGIIASGEYRYGRLGEPFQNDLDWRCDCCGSYGANIIAYAEFPKVDWSGRNNV